MKEELLKSLKRFLKRKISVTEKLLVAFLITGSIGLASQIPEIKKLEGSRNSILAQIRKEKIKIQRELSRIDKQLDAINSEQYELLKEADWYSTVPYEKLAVGLLGYEYDGDNRDKHYHYSSKTIAHDDERNAYNETHGIKYSGGGTSGWITRGGDWVKNMTTYDRKKEVVLLPIVDPPVVAPPLKPVVSTPTKINIATPKIQITKVTAPTIAPVVPPTAPTAPSAPSVPAVSVAPINVAVNVAPPSVTSPSFNIEPVEVPPMTPPAFTPPTPTLPTIVPPRVVKPNPSVPAPPSVKVPTWAPYGPPGSHWLGRGSYHGNFLNTDRWWEIKHNFFDDTPIRQYGSGPEHDLAQVHKDWLSPVFQGLSARGGDFYVLNKGVVAKDSNGNPIKDASGNIITGGATGKVKYENADMRNPDGTQYTGYTDVITNSNYINASNYTPLWDGKYTPFGTIIGSSSGTAPLAGNVTMNTWQASTLGNVDVNQYHTVLFQGGSHTLNIDNITAHIGGGVSLMALMYSEDVSKLTNSHIYLHGQTTLARDISIGGSVPDYTGNPGYGATPHVPITIGVDLTGTDIYIDGDDNTLFSIASSSGMHSHGLVNPDKGQNIKLGNTIEMNTKHNVVGIISNWVSDEHGHYEDPTGNNVASLKWFPLQHKNHPYLGELKFDTGSGINMYGSDNAGIILEAPLLGVYRHTDGDAHNSLSAKMSFSGDRNIGVWFRRNENFITHNGFYRGDMNFDFTFGDKLDPTGSGNQTAGNYTGGDDTTYTYKTDKTEKAIGFFADSGQRTELNKKYIYPSAEYKELSYWDGTKIVTPTDIKVPGGWMGGMNTNGLRNIYSDGPITPGAPTTDSNGNKILDYVEMDNIKLNSSTSGGNFKVTFGKYSRDNIAIVAKNGSVVEWSGNDISDHSPTSGQRAEGSTLAYAEGVWFNPNQRGVVDTTNAVTGATTAVKTEDLAGNIVTGSTGISYTPAGVVSDAVNSNVNTAFGGKYYYQDFRSTVNIKNDATVNSVKSIPFYAKDGGLITAQSITLNGYGSTGAVALADVDKFSKGGTEWVYAVKGDKTPVKLVTSWNADDKYIGPYAGAYNTSTTVAPTEVKIAGNITATVDNIDPSGNKIYDNTGAVAQVINGQNGALVDIAGNIQVHGLGALAVGNKNGNPAKVKIGGNLSDIKTGTDGALVALKGGVIEFGGGTIEHKDVTPGDHDNSLAFYAEEATSSSPKSEIHFKGGTTLNVYDGILFFGDKDAFGTSGSATNQRYFGMNNVTVNLQDNGINIGIFDNVGNLNDYDSTGSMMNSLVSGFTGGTNLNTNSKWYKATLIGGKFTVAESSLGGNQIDLDNISNGSTRGEAFNDLTLERMDITFGKTGAGVDVKSSSGKGLAISGNKDSTSNTQTGYNITNGSTINITGGTNPVATYVDYGHINNDGTITVGNSGAGMYGVNGSSLVNTGSVSVTGDNSLGIIGEASRTPATPEVFGADAGASVTPVTINNSGTVTITGNNGVGIYAKDNRTTPTPTSAISITNTGNINVTGTDALGIYSSGAGTVTLGGGTNPTTITVGGRNTGISAGVLTTNTDITLAGDITVDMGKGAVALSSDSGNITGSGKTLNVIYNTPYVSSDSDTIGVGIKTTKPTNDININTVLPAGATDNSKIIALMNTQSGSALNNSGIITIGDKDIGIYGDNNAITSSADITIGEESFGIYAKAGSVTVDGDKIKQGTNKDHAILVFGKDGATINLNNGTSGAKVDGIGSVGVYVEGNGSNVQNSANIELKDSNTSSDAKVAIYAKGTGTVMNMNKTTGGTPSDGTITVGKNNIGVYIDKDTTTGLGSQLTNSGTIDNVSTGAGEQNIGVYLVGDKFINSGTINVKGEQNIGIDALVGTTVDLSTGTMNVTATNMNDGINAIGVYASGNGTTITGNSDNIVVSANGIGVYSKGDNTTTLQGTHNMKLSSDASGKIGIGAYMTNGSYASGTLNVESTGTATASGALARPIGIYYGTGSTKNDASINVKGTDEVIGMYGTTLSPFTNNGAISSAVNSGKIGIGGYFENVDLVNNGTLTASNDSYGLILKGGNSQNNSTATITSNGANSIGIILDNGNLTNDADINSTVVSTGSTNGSIGIYQTGNSTLDLNNGTITSGAIGVLAQGGVVNFNGGVLQANNLGIVGQDGAKVTLNGGTINVPTGGTAIALNNTPSNTTQSTVELKNGTINIDGGTAVYAATGHKVDVTNNNMNINTGANGGTAIYLANGSTLTGGNINIDSTASSTTAPGVGVFFDQGTSPMSNTANITVTGNGLGIYATNTEVTNTGKLTVDYIGGYVDGNGILKNNSDIELTKQNGTGLFANNGTIELVGTNNIQGTVTDVTGIYLSGTSKLQGTGDLNLNTDKSTGIYLKGDQSVSSFTGTLNVNGKDSIGVYGDGTTTSTAMGSNINVLGDKAVGIYLKNGADLKYQASGTNKIVVDGTDAVGIYLDGSLSASSSVDFDLAGDLEIKKGIGLYIGPNSSFTQSGGTITNTETGIYAYVKDGTLSISGGTLNYANAIAEGTSGSITNSISTNTGKTGLQAINGATVTNTITGTLTSQSTDAVGMGALEGNVVNIGTVEMKGNGSAGIYVDGGTGSYPATGTSSGTVKVGDASIGYVAKNGGQITVTGGTTIGKTSAIMESDNGLINYQSGNINLSSQQDVVAGLIRNNGMINFNGSTITMGDKSIGLQIEDSNTTISTLNLGGITIADSVGILAKNSTVTNDITVDVNGGTGIYGENNSNIINSGTVTGTGKMTGIYGSTGSVTNNGTITGSVAESVGIYGDTGANIANNGTITVGDGATNASAGIYGLTAGTITNSGTITAGNKGVGIYGENGGIVTNSATGVINGGDLSTGIYTVTNQAENDGTINVGKASVGMYGENGSTLINKGSITALDSSTSDSVGIYGMNSTIQHDGAITVGKKGTGIYLDGGTATINAGSTIVTGESGISAYAKSGTLVNNTTLNLADYGVGLYSDKGEITNKGTINVGKSFVAPSTGLPPKISVGMVTHAGEVVNEGTINIGHNYGVGMLVNNTAPLATPGIAINRGQINLNADQAYGMQAKSGGIVMNDTTGVITINGERGRGIVATDHSQAINKGIIRINGNRGQGIFADYGSVVDNQGTIYVDSPDGKGVGIHTDSGAVVKNSGTIQVSGNNVQMTGGGTVDNIGDIRINGLNVSIDGVTLTNIGHITVNGPLDFGKIHLAGTSDYVGSISATTLNKGEIQVLPTFTQGSNRDMYIVQFLQNTKNIPNNGDLSVISNSVSFIADIVKDENDPKKAKIMLVKVPYAKMLKNTQAEEFGKGLDQIYYKAVGTELEMFDHVDNISSKPELERTFDMELRGNVYANIQERMENVSDIFERAVEDTKNFQSITKNTDKVGAIIGDGDRHFGKAGVEDFDINTYGAVYVKELEGLDYGKKHSFDIGFANSQADFDESGSDENIYTGQVGYTYERMLGKADNRLKYKLRGRLMASHHETTRKIELEGKEYQNKGKYNTAQAEIRNRIEYTKDYPQRNNVINKVGVYGELKTGYGIVEGFKESGDGIKLKMKDHKYFYVNPEVGVEGKREYYFAKGKATLKGKVSYERELLDEKYDGGNKMKIADTDAGYYRLEEPTHNKNIYRVGVGADYKFKNGTTIGVKAERVEGRVKDTIYSGTLSYTFD